MILRRPDINRQPELVTATIDSVGYPTEPGSWHREWNVSRALELMAERMDGRIDYIDLDETNRRRILDSGYDVAGWERLPATAPYLPVVVVILPDPHEGGAQRAWTIDGNKRARVAVERHWKMLPAFVLTREEELECRISEHVVEVTP